MQPSPSFYTITFKKDESAQFFLTTFAFKVTHACYIESESYLHEPTDVSRKADRAGRPHQCRVTRAFQV